MLLHLQRAEMRNLPCSVTLSLRLHSFSFANILPHESKDFGHGNITTGSLAAVFQPLTFILLGKCFYLLSLLYRSKNFTSGGTMSASSGRPVFSRLKFRAKAHKIDPESYSFKCGCGFQGGKLQTILFFSK